MAGIPWDSQARGADWVIYHCEVSPNPQKRASLQMLVLQEAFPSAFPSAFISA